MSPLVQSVGLNQLRTWPSTGRSRRGRLRLTPLRITLFYLALGILSLFISDVLFTFYLSEPLLSQVQALKAGVEVVLTAGLILVLTSYREAQFQQERNHVEQQRRELDVLHRVIRHNIRNDINVVMGHAELIRQEQPAEKIDEHSKVILDKVEDLAKYTSRATIIRQLSEVGDQLQTYDVNEVVTQLIDGNQSISEETTVSTNVPREMTFEAIPMFPELLDELVTNAIQHNDSSKPAVSIDASEGKDGNVIEIRVSDNGPGIPPAELEALRSAEEGTLDHLSGMGLWTVKRGVQNSGGTFTVERPDEEGTTALVRVPRASTDA